MGIKAFIGDAMYPVILYGGLAFIIFLIVKVIVILAVALFNAKSEFLASLSQASIMRMAQAGSAADRIFTPVLDKIGVMFNLYSSGEERSYPSKLEVLGLATQVLEGIQT